MMTQEDSNRIVENYNGHLFEEMQMKRAFEEDKFMLYTISTLGAKLTYFVATNKWGCVYENSNPILMGVGNTPWEAMLNFMDRFHKEGLE